MGPGGPGRSLSAVLGMAGVVGHFVGRSVALSGSGPLGQCGGGRWGAWSDGGPPGHWTVGGLGG